MRSIRTENAVATAAQFESLGNLLSRHRAITRVSLAALSFTILVTISNQSPAQAGPEAAPLVPDTLLPQSIGIAIATDASVTIPFGVPMDPASVTDALQVIPEQDVALAWNPDLSAVTVQPGRLWRADERYLVVVEGDARTSAGVGLHAARRFTFTTQIGPEVADFQVQLAGADLEPIQPDEAFSAELSTRSVDLEADPAADAAHAADAAPLGEGAISQPPTRTAEAVSATTAISIGFSAEMDRADVEDHFEISPVVAGGLTWRGTNLVFTPTERLAAGSRYTISVVGAHDALGNPLGGKANFSFTVQAGAQIIKTRPKYNEADVEPATIEMWFSQPVDVEATSAALAVVDADKAPLAGSLAWNDAHTQMIFTPKEALAPGATYTVTIGKGARDADGNPIAVSWHFQTKAPPPPAVRTTMSTRSAPAVPPPAPASTLAGYALNQVNAARSAYGFAPLVLDASISAVAYAHAYDQAINGYFSHYGLDGSTREQRLARGGVTWNWWTGENQCYLVGRSQQATLDWCHAQFMAEPYPGDWNHIANILNPNARRMGVGIATVGGKTVITWDFTD